MPWPRSPKSGIRQRWRDARPSSPEPIMSSMSRATRSAEFSDCGRRRQETWCVCWSNSPWSRHSDRSLAANRSAISVLLEKTHPTGIPSRRDTTSTAPPSGNREEVQKKLNFVGVIAFYFYLLWSHTYTRAALGVCQNSSCIHSHFVSLLLKPARGAWHIRGWSAEIAPVSSKGGRGK